MNVRVRSRVVNGVTVIQVAGELDIDTSPQLEAAIRAQLGGTQARLLIDLSDATYMDNTALRILTQAARKVRQSGGHVAVIYGHPLLHKIFEVTRLHELIPVFPSTGTALDAARTW